MDTWTPEQIELLLAYLDRITLLLVFIAGWKVLDTGRSLFDAFHSTAGTLNSDR